MCRTLKSTTIRAAIGFVFCLACHRPLAKVALVALLALVTAPHIVASTPIQPDSLSTMTIYGIVIDVSNGHPLDFASITHSRSGTSNVSNSDGQFSLKLPMQHSAEDEVTISFLGYVTTYLRVGDFSGYTSDTPRRISLLPVALSLEPAIIESMDALTLLREAFAKVKDNYPTTTTGLVAFYREIIRRQRGKYLSLSEAVLDINKSSYVSNQSDRSQLVKGRTSTDYGPADSLLIRFRGGVTSALDLDIVKNPFAGVNLSEVERHYTLRMDTPVLKDDLFFYVITFSPLTGTGDLLYSGRLYIECESLAIGRMEISLNVKGREQEAARMLVIKKPPNTKFYVTKAEYIVNYKRFAHLWYYDYSRMMLNFSTRRGHALFRSHYAITCEMAITAHNDHPVQMGAAERLRSKDILSEKVDAFRDDDFWGEYNVIEPDLSIESVVRRIIRQLDNRR